MIGGDMLLEDYKFTVGSQRELFAADTKPVSWFGAVSIILCLMCAYDSQTMDWMYSIGIVNSLIACGLAMFMNVFASALFVRTWRFNFGTQYADIFYDIFGFGKIIVRIIYLITLIYSALTTLMVGKDTIQLLVKDRLGLNTVLSNHYFIYYVIVPVFILPFVAVRKFSTLSPYFLVGNIALLIVITTSVYFFVASYKADGFDPEKKIVIISNDFWGTVNGYSAWSIVFWAQPFLCNVAQFLPNTKQKSIINVMIVTTFVCAFINILMSLCYHFRFWGSCDSNDFLSCVPQQNWFTFVGQLGSIFNCLITSSGYIILASREFIFMFHENISTFTMFFGDIAMIFLCSLLIVYYSGSGTYIIDLIGKITFMIMASILPPILYLRSFKVNGLWGIIALIYLIAALVLVGMIIKVSI